MASHDPDRPNVVLLLSDDQGPWALGCAGNSEIQTPAMDRMAARGVRFANFFCTSPVCSPARASLLTGQLPSQHGVHDWLRSGHVGPDGIDFLAGRTIYTNVLADNGYRLGLSGKWHLGANDRPRRGFVHWYAHQRGGGPYYGAPVVRDGRCVAEPGYVTDAITDDALLFLDRAATNHEPFYLSVHYTAPHKPWMDNHPSDLTELYANCAFDSCPQEPPHPWLSRDAGVPAGGEADTRAALVGYFAAVTGMDRGLGQVLDRLDVLGLTRSTLVVFLSDNGFNCGHHGIWGKGNGTSPQNMYDSSVKVPAIVSQPGRIAEGVVSEALLSGYDLMPTLLEHIGIPTPDVHSPGRSFAGTLTGGGDGHDERPIVVYDEYGPARMVRTAEWKLVRRYPHGPDELYDLRADPDETRNLVDEPGQQARVAELSATLRSWFSTYVDEQMDGARLPVSGDGQYRRVDLAGDEAFQRSQPPPHRRPSAPGRNRS